MIRQLAATAILWPAIAFVPLFLTHNDTYAKIFPRSWYERDSVFSSSVPGASSMPLPLGLCLGLLAVIVGQVFVLLYFTLRKFHNLGQLTTVQKDEEIKYNFTKEMIGHLCQPEGFVLLGAYLIGTWMFGLMPKSYYSFSGGVNWTHVAMQLLIQDCVQTIVHLIEHKLSPQLYQLSHKPHHRFTNPKLFDAFNGSLADTFFMILCPLFLTAHCVNANVWSYMAFGSLYANWLTLIHSEYHHPWDFAFQQLGFGTAADHHVHHKLFIKNYGHLFMYTLFYYRHCIGMFPFIRFFCDAGIGTW